MLHIFPSNITRRVYNLKICTAKEMLEDLTHTRTCSVQDGRSETRCISTSLHPRMERKSMQFFVCGLKMDGCPRSNSRASHLAGWNLMRSRTLSTRPGTLTSKQATTPRLSNISTASYLCKTITIPFRTVLFAPRVLIKTDQRRLHE